MSETHPPSPCTGVCEIDRVTATCRGCHRTLDEITAWFTASPARKHAILRALAVRQSVSVTST
ncbi:protein of unknown function DUF1289 [Novosphingobium aromaticivorans DSM 12444]|uniref:Fe-S protein n=1 Tax=Novosphingobium aromaticivorans (strain ATCC 700278 / DSM 12444 / CCUG 56034 / CIP 105152 / NBRC 16084 / F199) TaxID=279238 RepID=Q2GBT6_NOVAD|nr:DUF1289 domain-containing protein [Novosphingobium aromaticivorans]ABD24687.1 protein of unknown function DUF1289 [Novosphingobium aromaticivorans DSM 12444]SCY20682.1 hypothetical protein SAMN05660666_01031 [Novosphingobium aromaticivorans]